MSGYDVLFTFPNQRLVELDSFFAVVQKGI